MSNSFFTFKQFTIQQQIAAMKVCTDSCLFGAIVSKELSNKQNILDIGCGTLLLSLMYAQKNYCNIKAIDIEENAIAQSKQNYEALSFRASIDIEQIDLKYFTTKKLFDLIICNPPFYKNSLKSSNKNKNIALHNDEFTYNLLFTKSSELLDCNGTLALLIPFSITNQCISKANENGLFLIENKTIYANEKLKPIRSILFFNKTLSTIKNSSLVIKENNQYTQNFKDYLQDYYLYL